MQKLVENTDYVFVPIQDSPDAWAVRFLTGDFVESMIMFGAVSFNDVAEHLSFNFKLVSSPDDTLTEQNEDLQQHCARVLESIIEAGIENGTVILHEREKE